MYIDIKLNVAWSGAQVTEYMCYAADKTSTTDVFVKLVSVTSAVSKPLLIFVIQCILKERKSTKY